MKRLIPLLLAMLLTGCVATATQAPASAYLFTYFVKNGEDGLHLAASADGYTW